MCDLCDALISKMEAGRKLRGIPVLRLSDLKQMFDETMAARAAGKAEAPADKPKDKAAPSRALFDRLVVQRDALPPIIDEISNMLYARMPEADREKRTDLIAELFDVLLPLGATLPPDTFAALIQDIRGDIASATRAFSGDRGIDPSVVRELVDRLKQPKPAEKPPA